MRVLGRILLVVVSFLGVGFLTMHLLIERAVSRGIPEYNVRMGGALGGLFAGGAAATIVALVLLLGRGRSRSDSPGEDL